MNPLIVDVTVLVAVSITETVPSPFETYALIPLGENAAEVGLSPTGKVEATVLVVVSITETVVAEILIT